MRRQAKAGGGGKVFLYILLALVVIVVVGVGVLSMVDIAGDMVADMAAKTVKEQTGMQLSIRAVRGNPIKGYTFSDVALASEKGERLFSAETLGVGINFMSLFRGSPRLSNLAVGGVDMDLDRFVTEFNKIKFESSGGGGEVPIDRVSLQSSRFTSKWGEIAVADVGARLAGTLADISVAGAVNGVPVKGAINVDLQGQNININKVGLNIGKGTLTSAGSIRPTTAPEGGTAIDFQGGLKGVDLSEITAFWPEFLSSGDYNGTADVDFSIEGAGSNLLISGTLGYKGSKLGGYPLESLAANVKYSDMRLTVDNLKAVALGIPIDGSLAVAMKPGATPSVMVKLDGSDAPLSELAKLYPALGKVGGKIEKFTANIQGPTNELSGTIELSAPAVMLVGKRITDLAAQVKLAKSDTAAVSGKFVLEGAQGYLQGTIAQILTGANLNLGLKLADLDIKKVEDLIPDGKTYALSGALTADLTIKGKATAPSVGGTIGSSKFSAMNYTLDKPSVTFAYDRDTLTLKDSGGSWNGLPIKVNGSIGPLSSKTPTIAMTAQLALKPDNLKQFVPDIATYKLQGDINAGVKVSGKLPSPKIDLVASSSALSAFGTVSAKNLEVTTAIAGDLSKLDKIDLNIKAASVAAAGAGLQNLSAAIKKDGQQIRLENVSAKSGNGSITGGGTIALGAKDANLNLAFDIGQLDLAPLAKSGGLGVPLTGVLSGKVGVTGVSSNPEISFTGQAPSISVQGFSLTDLAADVSGNANALKINRFRANAGGAPLSATGNVTLGDPFKADLDISGSGLDLAALTAGIPDMKGQFAGKADLKFNVKSTAQGNNGTGSLRSDAVTAFGLKLSNVSLPLTLTGETLKSEGGTLDFYGGRVTNSLTFEMNGMKFSDTLAANGFDVNAVAQDATGGLGGKITGRGSLSMKISGNAAKAVTYSGSGQFSMGEGAITDFPGLNVATKLYGVNGIRYAKVTAPLRLETNRLIVARGSAAVPPANDPIYRSAKLAEDGTFTFDKKLYFVADLNVNFQLVNALSGGLLGGADALTKGGGLQDVFDAKNLDSVLKGAVSGGKEAAKDADFRDVTVKVTGTADKPSVSLVKVGQPSQKQSDSTASADATPSKSTKPGDAIKDRLMDAIAPQKTQQESQTPQNDSSKQGQQSQQKQDSKPNVEDQIRQGIDSLLKKK